MKVLNASMDDYYEKNRIDEAKKEVYKIDNRTKEQFIKDMKNDNF
jgi:hypothetical protein